MMRRLDSDEGENEDEDENEVELDDTCDESWYSSPYVLLQDNLFAWWELVEDTSLSSDQEAQSILNPTSIQAICIAEEQTIKVLRENDLCGSCSTGTTEKECLQPLSLIFVLKHYLSDMNDNEDGNASGNGNVDVSDMSCEELTSAYTNVQESFTQTLVNCAEELRASYGNSLYTNTTICPTGFVPQLVMKDFGIDGNDVLTHTTSYFHTGSGGVDGFDIFQLREELGYGNEVSVIAVYDTNSELFND